MPHDPTPPAPAAPPRVWCPADQLGELAELLMRDAEAAESAPETESER